MGIASVGMLSFQPYIYNTNQISASSLNKVNPISDNLTKSRTDFSGLMDAVQNENPLEKGETLNFDDMLEMQMQTGRSNAARIFGEDMAKEDSLTIA